MIEKNGIGISLTEEGYLRTLCTNRNQTSESLLCLTTGQDRYSTLAKLRVFKY